MPEQPAAESAVATYQRLLHDRLLLDLASARAARDTCAADVASYEKLGASLSALEEDSVSQLELQIDLGRRVCAKAHVPDAQSLYVHIGLGFHPELERREAIGVAAARAELLRVRLAVREASLRRVQGDVEVVARSLAVLEETQAV